MLASYSRNFIFLKTLKTASTSLELVFSQLCGPRDIISPIGARWELERAKLGVMPRNFSRSRELEKEYRRALRKGKKGALRRVSKANRDQHGCTGHMHAANVRNWVDAEFWEGAVKITSERHPYEKALSLARFSFSGDADQDPQAWEEHVNETVRKGRIRGFPVYSIEGQAVVQPENVIRYENLAEDTQRIVTQLGGADGIELPQTRTTQAEDRLPAAEVLTPWQRRRVRRRCADEFEFLGWED
ncbi:hypothetical protein [Capillimicrobium parvum]|uniref:Uncharacterized protein n=1 Tax=Capillimicrobium parvum TaxID=2884022 RepID=A0A9E7C2M9_9ACTN|nr:hypothetical protein [Capillimicrobium parvum]UGS37618.1 hypothetical protein DSM104329_04036 [Capillimicrobium parvum]